MSRFGSGTSAVIIGGLGNDVIDGGDGDDIEIQSFTAGGGSEDAIDFIGHLLSRSLDKRKRRARSSAWRSFFTE